MRLTIILILLISPTFAQAQDSTVPVRVTLGEAIQIALINNYALQAARIAEEDFQLQVKSGFSIAYPTIEGFSSYTRNVKEANPFAGSSAGDFFSGFAFIEWLGYNETTRTDGLSATNPITYAEFADRQRRGLDAAGIVPSDPSDNPFSVANQYLNSITLTYEIFNGPNWITLFQESGIRTRLKQVSKATERQEQVVIGEVREVFYGALLAAEEARVAAQSVERTRASRNETALRVSNGILPKIDRLTMDVELVNQESNLVQAQSRASDRLDQLKYLLGMPIEQELILNGHLEIQEESASNYLSIAGVDLFESASLERPDHEEARLARTFAYNRFRASKASRLPTLEVFANFNYSGRVPDNRDFILSDSGDPFSFSQGSNSYFSEAYWQSAFNVGLTLQWTIFNGFARRNSIAQAEVVARQASLNIDLLNASTKAEINTALRSLETAYHQIRHQEANVANAELNYQYTLARSNEGVANTLQLRAASTQLDTSKLNYLRAVHSFLVSQNTLEVALGIPLEKQSDIQFASANR
ncbi:MAG: TolC family protein [Bacteroidetes bacterium]|nr:TolC family protein [Bacteroidota bacterium]